MLRFDLEDRCCLGWIHVPREKNASTTPTQKLWKLDHRNHPNLWTTNQQDLLQSKTSFPENDSRRARWLQHWTFLLRKSSPSDQDIRAPLSAHARCKEDYLMALILVFARQYFHSSERHRKTQDQRMLRLECLERIETAASDSRPLHESKTLYLLHEVHSLLIVLQERRDWQDPVQNEDRCRSDDIRSNKTIISTCNVQQNSKERG